MEHEGKSGRFVRQLYMQALIPYGHMFFTTQKENKNKDKNKRRRVKNLQKIQIVKRRYLQNEQVLV